MHIQDVINASIDEKITMALAETDDSTFWLICGILGAQLHDLGKKATMGELHSLSYDNNRAEAEIIIRSLRGATS